MQKQNLRPNFEKEQGKVKERFNQLQTIFQYLSQNVVTASMLSKATGVPQKCITRYKRDLEKVGRLAEVKKDYCQLTGFKACYITTNKNLFPNKPVQGELF